MEELDKKKEDNNFWRSVFSEKGNPSSKRVLGAFMIIICLGLIVFLAIMSALNAKTPEGICPDNIKHLIELILILASSLLGISSITGIWKDKKGEPK
jgi:hypothetical protein